MTQDWPSHSGSRWEPVQPLKLPAGSHDGTPTGAGVAAHAEDGMVHGRRRRGPVVAIVLALLSIGTASAGVAYLHDPDAHRTDPPPRASRTPDITGDREAGSEPTNYRHRIRPAGEEGRRFRDQPSPDGRAIPQRGGTS